MVRGLETGLLAVADRLLEVSEERLRIRQIQISLRKRQVVLRVAPGVLARFYSFLEALDGQGHVAHLVSQLRQIIINDEKVAVHVGILPWYLLHQVLLAAFQNLLRGFKR